MSKLRNLIRLNLLLSPVYWFGCERACQVSLCLSFGYLIRLGVTLFSLRSRVFGDYELAIFQYFRSYHYQNQIVNGKLPSFKKIWARIFTSDYPYIGYRSLFAFQFMLGQLSIRSSCSLKAWLFQISLLPGRSQLWTVCLRVSACRFRCR